MTKLENITGKLHEEISKRLVIGDMNFPTEKELCEQYSCSRQTIRKVLSNLKDDKLITSRQGSGYKLTGISPDSRRNHVCLLFARPDEYIYPALIYDIEKELSSGYDAPMTVSVFETGSDFYKERTVLKELLKNPPLAILAECFSMMPNPNADLYKALEKKGCTPIFLYGTYKNMDSYPAISEGTYDAVYNLIKKLILTGHKKICGVFKVNNPQEMSKLYGFLSALRDNNLNFGKDSYIIADPVIDNLALSVLCQKNDAIIYCSDELAYPSVRWLREQGVINLNDKAVYSFDNSYLSQIGSLRIPSFHHKKEPLSHAVSERILSIIKGQPKISIVLPY
ncbi:GntR family transcriptional regulator [Butyrivibrio sp. X503]|uniref:GntR family transcriptional regulator n=1 Tax=Butyrivibrio sp. X503 TaxID=2364878 RepID=UPI000EA9E7F3|nr:GntR family transcriptional regulator [Butyrivibrio sp. X503]RKM54978.1 GntR family transcriptional regulator [Butyrivibrio sp. X503]